MEVLILKKKNDTVSALQKNISQKQVYIFDVDSTLTESKADITEEMAALLRILLQTRYVALLGGGTYEQLKVQCADIVINGLDTALAEKFLFAPVSGGAVYRYDAGQWKNIYHIQPFTDDEKKNIIGEIHHALEEINYQHPEKVYGEVIEDRGTQITFSALGQKAPVSLKKKWNETQDIRSQLQGILQPRLSELQVRVGGSTSVDITRTNKAMGAEKISEILGIQIEDMVFFGDQLYDNGNDAIVLETGIDAVPVSGPAETQSILEQLTQSQ